MSRIQKEQILKLKSSGKTFSEIANELSFAESTVKSTYYRILSSKDGGKKCKNCMSPLPVRSSRRTFCCDKCRQDWFKRHNQIKRTQYSLTCKYCGNAFDSYHSEQKYCSHKCYIIARYNLHNAPETFL